MAVNIRGKELTRSVISPPVSVAGSEAVGRVAEVSGGSGPLGAVGTGARHFEHGSILLAAVKRVVGGAVVSVPVHLGVGVIAGSMTAVVPKFSVANTEWIGSTFVVYTAGIVGFLSD